MEDLLENDKTSGRIFVNVNEDFCGSQDMLEPVYIKTLCRRHEPGMIPEHF